MKTNVVSAKEWEAARQQMLVKEKAMTRARDALAAERRRMPHPNLSKIHWRAHLATWPVPASCWATVRHPTFLIPDRSPTARTIA